MRSIALFIPILVVAGFVIHEAVARADGRVETPAVASQTVVPAPPRPHVAPVHLPETPEPMEAPEVAAAELSTQLAGLADLAVTLPAEFKLDTAMLREFTVSASARADLAATVEGLVELFEQQVDNEMTEEQIKQITGSFLADLAASLEAHLEVVAPGSTLAIPDTCHDLEPMERR
jgi:hypothetical protein